LPAWRRPACSTAERRRCPTPGAGWSTVSAAIRRPPRRSGRAGTTSCRRWKRCATRSRACHSTRKRCS
jgi:hypothetical protein